MMCERQGNTHSLTSRVSKYENDYSDDHQTVLGVYYNAQITRWLNMSPGVQYVTNPGGVKRASNAVVLGMRAQIDSKETLQNQKMWDEKGDTVKTGKKEKAKRTSSATAFFSSAFLPASRNDLDRL